MSQGRQDQGQLGRQNNPNPHEYKVTAQHRVTTLCKQELTERKLRK